MRLLNLRLGDFLVDFFAGWRAADFAFFFVVFFAAAALLGEAFLDFFFLAAGLASGLAAGVVWLPGDSFLAFFFAGAVGLARPL